MAKLKIGDRVRIATRTTTPEDEKSGLYYTFFGGLTGHIRHMYSGDEVAVEVEPQALTSEVRERHTRIRSQMKTKWLEGLSEEGRSRLTEREKDFRLRYVLLVNLSDLEPAPDTGQGEELVESAGAGESSGARPTQEDLDRAEEEELRRRAAAVRTDSSQ